MLTQLSGYKKTGLWIQGYGILQTQPLSPAYSRGTHCPDEPNSPGFRLVMNIPIE